ncbi:MAG: LacI family DNA-binding transcriptional regulator [Lentisphaerae bacterium]|nr:LacI family DNA-binding transcriptional regulator [Lentisphaerota bacterium]
MQKEKPMVTQKTIAKKLGVSPSLVSRALGGKADSIGASEKTVLRIRNEAKRLNYAPNAAALTLRGSKSMTIGVVIKDFDDPFFGSMTGELQRLSHERGFSLLLTGFDSERNRIETSTLLRYHLDALIICGSDTCAPWIKPFLKKGLPIVQIGSGETYPGINRVEMDEECGVALLLDHLRSLGHRDIGFMGENTKPHKRRIRIFSDLMKKMNLKTGPALTVSVPAGKNSGINAMKTLLGRTGRKMPTAVISADDSMAQGGLRAIHDLGLSVPWDISLTGIDDIPSASLMIPSLTTIRAPIGMMVRAAFELVIEKAAVGGNAAVLKFKPEIAIRESCSKAGLL